MKYDLAFDCFVLHFEEDSYHSYDYKGRRSQDEESQKCAGMAGRAQVRGMHIRPMRMYTSTIYVISVGEHVLAGKGWSGSLVLKRV